MVTTEKPLNLKLQT